ncbi:hypothetical protein [Halogeometricum limi]|uniref:Uncharacterized protein n=1 Tax=Halogeometricum limi TaxID=555875 RepID=A0A1I6HUX3_9EURY|nr:hypothetical protein [Halogeometricum limi]SFR58234.1 hypothetical protein SAMN04488124_2488 [Halogeometricum limi]
MSDERDNSTEPEPSPENSISAREEFLLQMYDQLWESVERVEGGIWSFIAAFAAIAVSFSAGFQGSISIFYAAVFSIIIGFWGMNLSIVSSRWFNRNLIQISNIESEFLEDNDYDKIIPRDYEEPGNRFFFQTLDFYNLNFLAFASAIFVILMAMFSSSSSNGVDVVDQLRILILTLIGSGITYYHYQISDEHIEHMRRNTKQIKRSNQNTYNNTPLRLVVAVSVISIILLTVSIFGNRITSNISGIQTIPNLICMYILSTIGALIICFGFVEIIGKY